MYELKPCPFCGEKAEIIPLAGIRAKYIQCKNCGISSEVSDNDKTLIELWNRRIGNAIDRSKYDK